MANVRKPEIWWAVCPTERCFGSIYYSREEAYAAMLKYNSHTTRLLEGAERKERLKDLHGFGWRVVKVKISEVREKKAHG